MILMIFFIGLLIGIIGLGGFLITPIVIYFLNINIKEAIVISLGSLILINLNSFLVYLKNKLVDFYSSQFIIFGAIPGVILGLTFNLLLPKDIIKTSLALFLSNIISKNKFSFCN